MVIVEGDQASELMDRSEELMRMGDLGDSATVAMYQVGIAADRSGVAVARLGDALEFVKCMKGHLRALKENPGLQESVGRFDFSDAGIGRRLIRVNRPEQLPSSLERLSSYLGQIWATAETLMNGREVVEDTLQTEMGLLNRYAIAYRNVSLAARNAAFVLNTPG